MNNFTYNEIFSLQFVINNKLITGIEIEAEIKKYIKNIEIKIKGEHDIMGNFLYVWGDYSCAHCRIPLVKDYLVNDYDNYLKHIAYYIAILISKEYFLKENN